MERPLRSTAFSSLALVAGVVALLGCPPSDYGQRCRIAGDDATPCGQCIARGCQSALDTCCAESYGCAERLTEVDACSLGQGCSKLYANIPTGTGVVSSSSITAVASCVQRTCASVCTGGTSGTGTSTSRIACTDLGGSCSCFLPTGSQVAQNPISSCSTDDVQLVSGYTQALCCATSTWPDRGSCRCIAATSSARCGVGDTEVTRCL